MSDKDKSKAKRGGKGIGESCTEATLKWGLTILFVLGSLAGIVSLILLSVITARAQVLVDEAPGLLSKAIVGFMEGEGGNLLDAYVETKLMPDVGDYLMGYMLGTLPPDGTSTADQRARAVSRCPVNNPATCTIFRQTCRTFATCRHERTQAACTEFSQNLNVACLNNKCSEYQDASVCRRVTALCTSRFACAFNATSCLTMEGELASLCTLVS